jgi:hypothetical protein
MRLPRRREPVAFAIAGIDYYGDLEQTSDEYQ